MRLIENELTREVKDIGYEPLIIPRVANYHMYLADVQKYLREEHMMEMSIIANNGKWWWEVESIPEQIVSGESELSGYESYEEALEQCVLEALHILRK